MRLMVGAKVLLTGGLSALAVLVGAAPASATHARDDAACDRQYEHLDRGVSPSCLLPGQVPPGIDGTDFQHNETLVRDVA